jgi:hypothetical protein
VQNIEASKELAKKSQYSAKKMEAMTEAMHRIAVKTKQETVSMRIITLVTLFFLPGTFISVSYLSSLYQSVSTSFFNPPVLSMFANSIMLDDYEHRYYQIPIHKRLRGNIPTRGIKVVSCYYDTNDVGSLRRMGHRLPMCRQKAGPEGVWREAIRVECIVT